MACILQPCREAEIRQFGGAQELPDGRAKGGQCQQGQGLALARGSLSNFVQSVRGKKRNYDPQNLGRNPVRGSGGTGFSGYHHGNEVLGVTDKLGYYAEFLFSYNTG